jgi:hypothetical protein
MINNGVSKSRLQGGVLYNNENKVMCTQINATPVMIFLPEQPELLLEPALASASPPTRDAG